MEENNNISDWLKEARIQADKELEESKKELKKAHKEGAYAIIDGFLLDIQINNKITEEQNERVKKLCETFKKYPDLISNIMTHEPKKDFLSKSIDNLIDNAYETGNSKIIEKISHYRENMVEGKKEIKTLEDMLFYKSEIFGSTAYNQIITAIKNTP